MSLSIFIWCIAATYVDMLAQYTVTNWMIIAAANTLRSRQNWRHISDNISKYIFLDENVWISLTFSLKFVPKGPINNIPTLVQIMTWRRQGDKPLSEPMMVRLGTNICVTRPPWVEPRIPTAGLFHNLNIIKVNELNIILIAHVMYVSSVYLRCYNYISALVYYK